MMKIDLAHTTEPFSFEVKVSGSCYPWHIDNTDCAEWLSFDIDGDIVTLFPTFNYSYEKRSCDFLIIDARGNVETVYIEQNGYMNLSIEADESVILHEDFYKDNEFYELPVRVNGGIKQTLTSTKLKNNIEQIDDNSFLYNEFILKIPKSFEGSLTLKHGDSDGFKKYCKENNIDADFSQLSKKFEVLQLTQKDIDGEVVFEVNGEQYTNELPESITVNSRRYVDIKIVSSWHLTETDDGYVEDNDCKFNIDTNSNWIGYDYNEDDNIIRIKSLRRSMFGDKGKLILTDKHNRKRKFIVNVKQEKGT